MSQPTYAFTGPEKISTQIAGPLSERLEKLPVPGKVITGAAFGVDTVAHRLALTLWPEAEHEIIVPRFRHNKELVIQARKDGSIKVTVMPKGTGPLDRNTRMVQGCTHLIACPMQARWYRSGTWNTINTAHRLHRRVYMYPVRALLRANLYAIGNADG